MGEQAQEDLFLLVGPPAGARPLVGGEAARDLPALPVDPARVGSVLPFFALLFAFGGRGAPRE